MFINSRRHSLKIKAIMLKFSRLCGLGMAKKVPACRTGRGAGDGLRDEPFFGLAFLLTFSAMEKVRGER